MYGLNNPVKYNDPSGHDVGCAGTDASNCSRWNHVKDRNLGYKTKNPSYLQIKEQKRNPYSPYMQGWTNFSTAGFIYTNPNTSLIDRYKSGIYLGVWGGAHLALVVGGIILIKGTIVAPASICATNTSCVDRASQKITETSQEVLPTIDNAVTQIGNDVVSSAQNVIQVADEVGNWLGDDLVSIRNEAGDFILRNAENTKRFRFDFFNTSPHQNPHMHLEWLNEYGEWLTKRIFPNDVIPH